MDQIHFSNRTIRKKQWIESKNWGKEAHLCRPGIGITVDDRLRGDGWGRVDWRRRGRGELVRVGMRLGVAMLREIIMGRRVWLYGKRGTRGYRRSIDGWRRRTIATYLGRDYVNIGSFG